jgi:adenosine deaminase
VSLLPCRCVSCRASNMDRHEYTLTLCDQTDDVGVFCSPLSQEYQLAAQHFGLETADIRALCERAVDAVFAGEHEKERLRTIYAEWDWEAWGASRDV